MSGRRATLGLLLAAALGCGGDAPARPNLLLVVVDTLRADHLGCYGAARDTSPSIDALAAEGVRFGRAYAAAPWTMPSVASMLTGLHPSAHGVTNLGRALPDEALTLAEILAANGYATAGIVSHMLISSHFGYDQGCEVFGQRDALGHDHVSTAGVVTEASAMLGHLARDERPFFLTVHLFDPHFEYRDHAEVDWAAASAGRLDGELSILELRDMLGSLSEQEVGHVVDRYDEEIRHTDDGIGRLMQQLRDLGAWEDTLVVVTADHGEEFLERGWLGHTRTLHEELVRVPLIVRRPGEARGGAVDEQPVSLVALAPTLLELLGLDATSYGFHLDSFAARLDGEPAAPDAGAFCEVDFTTAHPESDPMEAHLQAWVGQRYKLVRDTTHGALHLYDLVDDPGELHDLVAERDDLVQAMLARLEHAAERAGQDAAPVRDRALSDEDRAILESLGYLGRR